LMTNAFTDRHRRTLELLSSQAAVSLVNARLYESLEGKVLMRTEELNRMTMKDGLTGIGNRRSFDERLSGEWRRGLRSGRPLTLFMIDIDFFKHYNDRYGHLDGDQCIRAVASALEATCARATDMVARYGGEEFAVLIAESNPAIAHELAEACVSAIAALAIPHAGSGVSDYVSISVGVSTLTADAELAADELIKQADQALYQAKREGRNRCVVFG
jgi:diguanylate cyclase (GGDEF)-like protein